jgi:nitrite reductase (NADH) large subunit
MSKNQTVLPPDPEDLMLGARGGKEESGAGVMALPDDASICSCEAISKGQICGEVLAGNNTLDAIKKCTKAGTGCGGCVPMVKDLINETMKSQGCISAILSANTLSIHVKSFLTLSKSKDIKPMRRLWMDWVTAMVAKLVSLL